MTTQGTKTSPTDAIPAHTISPRAATPPTNQPNSRPPTAKRSLPRAALTLCLIALSTSLVLISERLGAISLVIGITALEKTKRTDVGRRTPLTAILTAALAIVLSVLLVIAMLWYTNTTQKCYRPAAIQHYKHCVHQQLTGP
jgi:hypothetical protein